MAMELPVIATDVAGIPEAVENTSTGVVVPAGETAHLVSVLIELSDDEALRRRLGQEGRRRATSEYGWNDGFRRYRDALQSLDRDVPLGIREEL
jgi:glycosyltransferase involved in cell wall biosynthesis